MKSFKEFVDTVDPKFFESMAEKPADKKDKKDAGKKDAKKEEGGKKLPPWMKKKEDC